MLDLKIKLAYGVQKFHFYPPMLADSFNYKITNWIS